MNYQHIMNLAVKRRATLIRRLEAAQARYDDVKCDQIMMMLQGENRIIGDCKQMLEYSKMSVQQLVDSI